MLELAQGLGFDLADAFAGDVEFLRASRSAEALDALGQLASEQYRRGAAPLGPREWGMFLDYIVWREKISIKK